MNFRESHIVTPGPYRATKLWNEVTKLFRAGMPLKKHRQHFRLYGSCFTASAAVDWLHELLRNNSNFGPEVTRQQTVQLLKKFLKNHVIEDVKGKWGSEDIEDNSQLYRFPPTSPLKPIPRGPQPKRNKNSSMKEKDVFFKFRNSKKFDPETQENVCPSNQDTSDYSTPKVVRRRELTEDDILDVWREITLTHLQKTLGLTSLEDVLHPNQINCQHIVYNMTNVNKHGVVTLDDKTGDLPHWVLSAMKCLANWPKYDSNQPSYPGFERDVFKTVSDYFLNQPQPLLTYEYYELFVNVLVLCGYIVVPKTQRGKRKNHEELGYPHPTKAPHLVGANVFRSTECLLYSLIRKEAFDEPDSPMMEVFGCKELSRCSVAEMDASKSLQLRDVCHRRGSAGDITGGSSGAASVRHRPRSCSLEGIIDYPTDSPSQPVGESAESLALSSSEDGSVLGTLPRRKAASLLSLHPKANRRAYASMTSLPSSISSERGDLDICSQIAGDGSQLAGESQPAGSAIMCRPSSICNHTGIDKYRKMSASCFSINAPVAEITMKPDYSSSVGLRRPHMFNVTAGRTEVRAGPCVGRRCLSSVDLSHKPALSLPTVNTLARHLSLDQSLLQPQLERVAVEALQLCTLLLPPASRRKLQLLMRMISRMSQNVDMPRLHDAIGTRTLMVHTFSRCVLRCEEELDLDELLATRLVSFLMDHHQEILQVPVYLQNAVQDHIAYLRKVQVSYPGSGIGITPPAYSFCRQISSQEFEEQKMSVSQAAIADLLESLVKDKTLSVKEKKRRLKQFQKEYPDIYRRRFPTTESEAQLFADKPKIKPPMLISMKKSKAFSIRN